MIEKSALERVGLVSDLDPGQVLRAAEAGVRSRRAEEVADLQRLLDWADLNCVDPQTEPNAVPVSKGGPRLVRIAGEGTPQIADLCLGEIAIAREASWAATRNATAEALDLRHRLPLFWNATRELRCEPWVARKVARMSRPLTKRQCALVDAAMVEAIDESPGRVIDLAEAKIIEADPEGHRRRLLEAERKRGVWFPEPAPGEQVDDETGTPGLRTMIARLKAGEFVDLHERVDQIAELLAEHGTYDPDNPPSRAQLYADALTMLADPAAVLSFLEGAQDDSGQATVAGAPRPLRGVTGTTAPSSTSAPAQIEEPAHTAEVVELAQQASRDRSSARPPATMVIHLSEDVLTGDAIGVARVQSLGPMLLEQLATLLGHRHITVEPVVDLHDGRSVNGYEHPTDVRHRTELRTLGDAFPHAASGPGARIDHDHPVPYGKNGPPGQTGDHNDAPLTRRHHRAKTFAGYRVHQVGANTYRWTTSHGLVRIVDGAGTHHAD